LEPEEKNAKSNNAEDENTGTVVNLREGRCESYPQGRFTLIIVL
jgi:hypothetical protein